MGNTNTTIIDTSNPAFTSFWLRDGTPFPAPSVMANMICRVVLGVLANVIMWVPLTLLHRHGEFSAVCFIASVMTLNLLTVVNALIWRNDDVDTWYKGWGYCDVYQYINYPLLLLYTTSIFAIMKNIAEQISLMRVALPSSRERRRKTLIQALIIFPVPIIQMAWVYPLAVHRYTIMTLAGCAWWPIRAWPTLVFILLPTPLFSLGAGYYAVITHLRFRQLAKDLRTTITSANSVASGRQRRAKRRLYLMTISIMIPYLPLVMFFFVSNLRYSLPLQPYSFSDLESGKVDGLPWNSIVLMPTVTLDFASVNDRWVPIITALPIFLYFGMTKEAINVYRRYLLFFGLGYCFPRLKDEYDPDEGSRRRRQRREEREQSQQAIFISSHTTQSSKLSKWTRSIHSSATDSGIRSTRTAGPLGECQDPVAGAPHQPAHTFSEPSWIRARMFRDVLPNPFPTFPFTFGKYRWPESATPHTREPERPGVIGGIIQEKEAVPRDARHGHSVETRIWSHGRQNQRGADPDMEMGQGSDAGAGGVATLEKGKKESTTRIEETDDRE